MEVHTDMMYCWILIIIGFFNCKEISTEKEIAIDDGPKVVSFENTTAINELQKMDLESSYLNILDPRNVSENEIQNVYNLGNSKIYIYLRMAINNNH